MLLSVLPEALVLLAIVPGVYAVAVFAVVLVIALVHAAVLPGIHTLAMHVVVLPLARVLTTIGPDVDADTVDLVFEPLAFVHGAVVPDVLTVAVLHAFFVAALIATAILPALHALAVLQVVLPLAFVLRAINMNVDAISICLIIFPLAVIDVAISVPEFAAAISLVLAPLTLIASIVRPDLDAGTMAHLVQQIALVYCAIFESELFDELEAFVERLLLKLEEVRVLGGEKLRDFALIIVLTGCDWQLLVLLGDGAVTIVADLLRPMVVVLSPIFDLDFGVFFRRVDASARVAHDDEDFEL